MTRVARFTVNAHCPVLARLRVALINVCVTVVTGPAGVTLAGVLVQMVVARTVLTRRRGTLVNLLIAVSTVVSRLAHTRECGSSVNTAASLTRARSTFVNVRVTHCSSPAR